MKKPKKFNEWFDTVYIVSEQGEYDAYNTWGDKVCDRCNEFLEKLLKIKQVEEEE